MKFLTKYNQILQTINAIIKIKNIKIVWLWPNIELDLILFLNNLEIRENVIHITFLFLKTFHLKITFSPFVIMLVVFILRYKRELISFNSVVISRFQIKIE